MKENNTVFDKIIICLEFAFVLIIPFIIAWSITPTNILNSNSRFRLLETIGIYGSGLMLSVINLFVGSIENLILLVVFCAVVFGGATV